MQPTLWTRHSNSRQRNLGRPRHRLFLHLEPLEDRTLLTFFPAPTIQYLGTSSPSGIVLADFDGNAHLDLAFTSQAGDNLSVLLQQSDGTFSSPLMLNAGDGPVDIVAQDINKDGKLDLAVVNLSSDNVSVLLGNGNGTFQNQTTYAVGDGPQIVRLADINGDDKLDLLVANTTSVSVSVLLGNGDGSFQPQTTFAAGPSLAIDLAVADLQGDGNLDLVVANYQSAAVSVLLGTGNGSFTLPTTFAVGSFPNTVVVADLDGDSKLDLAVNNRASENVSVLLGLGNGSLAPQTTFNTGPRSNALVLGDLTGDGNADLALRSYDTVGNNRIIVLLSNGNGTFAAPLTTAVSDRPRSLAIGDITGDGKLDLLVGLEDNSNLLPGKGDGTFETPTLLLINDATRAVASADFDSDGHVDLAVAQIASDRISFLMGQGDGTFRPGVTIPVGDGPLAFAVGDINGDGKPDLVVGNAYSDNVSVLLGRGDGTFNPPTSVTAGDNPSAVILQDFDGDSKLDLAIISANEDLGRILLGQGNGNFGPPLTFATGDEPRSLILGELNGDGKVDLVVSNYAGDTVGVLLGNGNGSFGPQTTFNAGDAPRAVVLGDVNGDQQLDVITADLLSSSISVLLGLGNGSFSPRTTFAVGNRPSALAINDLDGDGLLDLVVANRTGLSVGVLLGNGNGTFAPQMTFESPGGPRSLALGDFNGDARLDIASANFLTSTVRVLLNAFQTSYWDGGGTDANWTTAANWVGDRAPRPGDILVFPAGAARPSSTNDFPVGTSFRGLILEGAGYTLSGNVAAISSTLRSGGLGENRLELILSLTGNVPIEVEAGNTLRLIGGLSGTQQFRQIGAGRLIVAGPVVGVSAVVETGNLQLTPQAALATVDVRTGATLSGSGQADDVTVRTGAVLSPGTSPGTLNLTGTLILEPAATLQFDVDAFVGAGFVTDLIRAQKVTVAGSILNLQVAPTGLPFDLRETFFIIDNRGTEPIDGVFQNLPEGAVFVTQGLAFRISYHGGDGNDVVLTRGLDTTVTLVTSASPILVGQELLLTVTLVSLGGVVPTGDVRLEANGTIIGRAAVDSQGQTFLRPVLAAGRYTLNAIYEGDVNFGVGASSGVVQDVLVMAPLPLAGQLVFSSISFEVNETSQRLNLTITRVGGSEGTVTVEFATLDGTANATTDYQAINSVLTFVPGQTTGTIAIDIANDQLVEDDESFTVVLRNPTGGAVLGTPHGAVVVIREALVPGTTADSPRPANLDAAAIVFAKSPEHYHDFVTKAYARFLGRQPDAPGLQYWVTLMQSYETSNHQQGLRQEQIEAGFLVSTEYLGRYGGKPGEVWVRGIYRDLLERDGETAGVTHWLAIVQSGGAHAVGLGFTTSLERARNRIAENYSLYLGRVPDDAGLNYWVTLFQAGGTTEDIIAGFVGSPEYYANANKGAGNVAKWIRRAYADVLFRQASVNEFEFWLRALGRG